jgi:hypothetical protein
MVTSAVLMSASLVSLGLTVHFKAILLDERNRTGNGSALTLNSTSG